MKNVDGNVVGEPLRGLRISPVRGSSLGEFGPEWGSLVSEAVAGLRSSELPKLRVSRLCPPVKPGLPQTHLCSSALPTVPCMRPLFWVFQKVHFQWPRGISKTHALCHKINFGRSKMGLMALSIWLTEQNRRAARNIFHLLAYYFFRMTQEDNQRYTFFGVGKLENYHQWIEFDFNGESVLCALYCQVKLQQVQSVYSTSHYVKFDPIIQHSVASRGLFESICI